MSKKSAIIQGTMLVAAIGMATTAAAAKDAGAATRLTPAEVVADQCEAWNTTDRGKRDLLLERVYAPDGVYNDPSTYAEGPAALSDEIGKFQLNNPGARFWCSAPQTHHSAMRVSWVMLGADGKVVMEGMDFYQLAPDGLIRRLTGFFGPPQAYDPK